VKFADAKLTAASWAAMTGATERAARSWLAGSRPAPAWAVWLAAKRLATSELHRAMVLTALSDHLARAMSRRDTDTERSQRIFAAVMETS
jgi:hypothetical protein